MEELENGKGKIGNKGKTWKIGNRPQAGDAWPWVFSWPTADGGQPPPVGYPGKGSGANFKLAQCSKVSNAIFTLSLQNCMQQISLTY